MFQSVLLFPGLIFISTLIAYLLVRRPFYGFLLGAPVLWSIASVAAALQKLDFITSPLWTFLTLSILIIVGLLLRSRNLKQFLIALQSAGPAFMLALLLEGVTRQFRLAGVYFGDSPTILANAASVADGGSPFLGLFVSLKRSVGTYSVHSLGFLEQGEYLVAYHPYVFLVALIAVAGASIRLIGNRIVGSLFIITGATVLVSTEAIIRHLYFINSHAGLMLLIAIIASLLVSENDKNIRPIMLLLLVAAGILRPDYGAIMLVLVFLLALRKQLVLSRVQQGLAIGAVVVPIYLLGVSSGVEISLSEFVIFSILAVVAGVAIFIFAQVLYSLSPRSDQVFVYSFWALVALLIAEFLNSESDISPLVTNFFLFEGLWGYSGYLFVAIVAASFIFSRKEPMHQALAELLLLSLLLILAVKLTDVFLTSGAEFGLARVGWGDTVNRLMVSILPIVVLISAQLLGSILKPKESSSTVAK